MPSPTNHTPALPWARFLVLASVLFALFFQLGTRALNEPDEGRYSEVGREMMADGDYLTPSINGIPHLSKPPLTYWCVAGSLRLFGVNEFAARLPATLAALGTLLALYLIVRDAADEPTALWAVLMLTGSALFFLIARLITADMLLTCWIAWSVWALWRRSDLFFVFLALGLLTKGPVAVLLPLLALVGLRPRLRDFHWGKGALVFLAIAAPWFIALTIINPELWRYFLLREVVQRVASNEHGRSQDWWFLLPVLLGGALPWTFLMFGRHQRNAATWMFAAWAGLGLVLFSISKSKLPTYVLPLMPPVIALAAMAQPRRWLNALTALAMPAGLILVTHYMRTRCGLPTGWGLALNAAAIAGAVAALWAALANRTSLFRGLCAGTFLSVLLAVVALIPSVERQLRHNTSSKFFADRIRREDPERKALVICHRCLPPTLPFYLQTKVWSYNPSATTKSDVFEFQHPAPGTPFIVTDATTYRAMMADGRRIFCVASADEAEKMHDETDIAWYELERTGKGVLLSNQP